MLGPMRARRSCLSVPGASAKMLDKARGLTADEVILDLEDSVAPGEKDEARSAVVAAVRDGEWSAATVSVRINAPVSPWCYRDVIELVEGAGERLACLVIPKAERASDVDFVARLAQMVEQSAGRERPVALQGLIETATGLRHVHEVAHANERLEALIVGYADLAASLGRSPGSPDDPPTERWSWVLDTVLVAARDAGVQAIDGPYLDIADVEGCRRWAQGARALGYDGKWALHPDQVAPLNEVFSPTADELEQAAAVLRALEESRGVALLDGEMIDEASRKLAVETIARGEAAGATSPS